MIWSSKNELVNYRKPIRAEVSVILQNDIAEKNIYMIPCTMTEGKIIEVGYKNQTRLESELCQKLDAQINLLDMTLKYQQLEEDYNKLLASFRTVNRLRYGK